jgi:potassium-transporting ATPase ATP-binding subunit
VLLLDKTGTITFGNRMAAAFVPVGGVSERDVAEAAFLSSLADDTAEGRSIVELATRMFGFAAPADRGISVPFTAQTRMSGVDLPAGRSIRKGAADAVSRSLTAAAPQALDVEVRKIANGGGTPLVVAENGRALGVINLKDVVKPNIRERFAELRRMGIRTVMITGDNPLTAAAIAAEAGVDDFLAEATPEAKLALIRKEQAEGRLVAMCGDGSNDAPALAQADVGVAMNAGTPAAKEAGNLIDLDSDPTKLIEIVMVGKQLLISRGALTTFSIANDVAKYFAILPALFAAAYPGLGALNIMGLASPQSAILSAIIFNALVIIALIPIALKGVAYRPASASSLLARNLLVYGVGGLIVPFLGIKIIDLIVNALGLA